MRIEDVDVKRIVEPLQSWFDQNHRTLPWRSDPTPYHVWISEIMLQQTRVEAVIEYYRRFLETCPDVEALAGCDEETYLKLWEGLGYYSRVRNLHKAAVQIVESYDGELPSDFGQLLKLPGIGRYTAGAVASLAYGKPEPAVDGNVLRVLTRIAGDDSDITLDATKLRVETALRKLMQENQDLVIPRIFNQALMELGALVCVPNGAPHCETCPLKDVCRALSEQRIEELPVKKKAKDRRIEERTVLVLKDNEMVALRKRPAKGLLAGLWELPNYSGYMTMGEVAEKVRDMGYSALHIEPLEGAKHIFSHVEWHMIGYRVRIEEEAFATAEQMKIREKENYIFVDAETREKTYAVPTAFAAYTKRILG